jgi:hypothetical protein
MAATNGDIESALRLYEKNLALSEALFGLLHGLEVAARNSLNYVLSNDIGVTDWFHDDLQLPWPSAPRLSFTVPMNGMIREARKNAGGPTAPTGKVIAELPFGFWSSLVAGRFDPLWRVSLHKAFPNAAVPRRVVHWRLETLRRLRNRIAHHEPVLTSRNEVHTGFADQPTTTLPEILQCVEWISPPTAAWLIATTRCAQAADLLDEVAASGVSL